LNFFYLKYFLCTAVWLCGIQAFPQTPSVDNQRVIVGAEQTEALLHLICDKQAALVVNHSSRIGNTHLVDTLYEIGCCIDRILAPEHGFRGAEDAGAMVSDGQDLRTGIPIVSLYGKKRKPTCEDLEGIDVVIFDIQDVGARFYTYISTLFYVLEACAEQGKQVIVLDRPNPNGHYVDGPVLDMRYSSFVGIAPLPVVHGCTVGELARLFAGEYWIGSAEKLDLQVIPCKNYTHHTPYDLPVKPSPNLPNTRAALLYPSLCFFEGTEVSIGRGTSAPFQMVGHPDFPEGDFSFIPQSGYAARYPPQEGKICWGKDLRDISPDSLRRDTALNLRYLFEFFDCIPHRETFFLPNHFFDLLAGNSSWREQMLAGKSEAEIRAGWQYDLGLYKEIRRKYLLYPEE
jgi:uncharacterized protein YbbC (DUF1343 family)